MGTESFRKSIPVDLQRSHPWEPILPAAPLLSSQSAGWTALHLEHHRQPAHATPDYSLPHHTIVVCLDYQAREFGVSGRTYRHLMNGNVGIAPAGQVLSTEAWGTAEYLVLALDPVMLKNVAADQVDGDRLELIPQIIGRDPLIYQMAQALWADLASGYRDGGFYAEAMATALAAHLIRHHSTQPQPVQQPLTSEGLPNYKLREAIAYIHDHLDQKITLANLAAILNLSPYYFGRLFKQSIGLSPYQFVLKTRIERAKELLADPKWAIADIALEVGFQSQSHFTRMFKHYSATTPKTYRDSL